MVVKKKQDYVTRLASKFNTYDKAFIVNADNVTSQQLQDVRKTLRGQADIVFGKNTMMKFVISQEKENNPNLLRLVPHLKGNVGLVFTNGDLHEIRQVLLSQKVQAPAKADALAPVDVMVPKQMTSLGPEKTAFFQALQVPTKITRGVIEIISDVDLIKAGDIVTASQATLLQTLKIFPFEYGLKIQQIFENGSCYSPDALDITEDDIKRMFLGCSQRVAAVSLAINRITPIAVVHKMVNTFKAVLAVSIASKYQIKENEEILEYLEDPTKFAVSVAPVAKAVETKEAAKEEAPAEEESDEGSDIGMGLFD